MIRKCANHLAPGDVIRYSDDIEMHIRNVRMSSGEPVFDVDYVGWDRDWYSDVEFTTRFSRADNLSLRTYGLLYGPWMPTDMMQERYGYRP